MSALLNKIPETQNTERFLGYLAASSTEYGVAKKLVGLQIALTVAIPIVFSAAALLQPGFQEWAALYGVIVTLCDLFLIDTILDTRKKNAAKIQESFDCELMELPWNSFKVGEPMPPEYVRQSGRKYKGVPQRDWYSVKAGALPLTLARVALQRASIVWDSGLRRQYSVAMLALMVIGAVTLVVVGFTLRMPLNAFVLTAATLLPTFQWFIKEYQKQCQSIGMLDRLSGYIRDTWRLALSNSVAEEKILIRCREFQDELFLHRSTNQPVPTWFYRLFKRTDEDAMHCGIDELVREAVSHISK